MVIRVLCLTVLLMAVGCSPERPSPESHQPLTLEWLAMSAERGADAPTISGGISVDGRPLRAEDLDSAHGAGMVVAAHAWVQRSPEFFELVPVGASELEADGTFAIAVRPQDIEGPELITLAAYSQIYEGDLVVSGDRAAHFLTLEVAPHQPPPRPRSEEGLTQ